MNKIEKKVQRRIGSRVFNHQVDGANDFIEFACRQGFKYRLTIAWSLLIGKPIRMEKVLI